MSSLAKIEGILSALGYENGTIGEIKVSDGNDILSISFNINRPKEQEKEDRIEDIRLPWKDNKRVSYTSGLNVRVNKPVKEEPKKKVTFEEYCKENSKAVTYDPVKEKVVEKQPKPDKKIFDDSQKANNWKTPTPRVILRKIFFNSYDNAKKFAEEYEKDFEKNDFALKQQTYYRPYDISKNTINDELFKRGYGTILEFRMNGKTFKLLEEMENLKKIEGGKPGGSCMRYKEV